MNKPGGTLSNSHSPNVANLTQHVQSNASFGPIQNQGGLVAQAMGSNRNLQAMVGAGGGMPDGQGSLQSIQLQHSGKGAVQQYQSNSSLNNLTVPGAALLNQQSSSARLDGAYAMMSKPSGQSPKNKMNGASKARTKAQHPSRNPSAYLNTMHTE